MEITFILKWVYSLCVTPHLIEIHQSKSGVIMNINIDVMSSATCSKMVTMLDVFRQIYRKCVTFSPSIKVHPTYKILQCYVSLCIHIMLVEQLNRNDNNFTFSF